MEDIITEIDRWIGEAPSTDDVDVIETRVLMVDAVNEIERLREVLGKISMLGQNAAPGSYLEECGVLAASALMRPVL
jgi:hypothetical protein